MTYVELISASQDACDDPDRDEILARLVVWYVCVNGLDIRRFDFRKYFLALEME